MKYSYEVIYAHEDYLPQCLEYMGEEEWECCGLGDPFGIFFREVVFQKPKVSTPKAGLREDDLYKAICDMEKSMRTRPVTKAPDTWLTPEEVYRQKYVAGWN
jgi:hypothetical protein